MTSSFTTSFWSATSAVTANATGSTNSIKNAKPSNFFNSNKIVNNNNIDSFTSTKFEEWLKITSEARNKGEKEIKYGQNVSHKLLQTEVLKVFNIIVFLKKLSKNLFILTRKFLI